jgi:alpha-galactosidase
MKRRGRFADATDYARHNAASGAFWDHRGLVAMDFFRRFGALGAAGDRHLVEFVPWYLAAGEAGLHRWGVVMTPGAYRAGTWKAAPGVKPAPDPLAVGKGIPKRLKPSGEEGVQQMCALLGLSDLDTNVNIPNHGQLPQLPMGAIVETNAQFRHNNLRAIVPTPLPDALAPLVQRVCKVQRLTLEAARECDFGKALQAVLLDPLCRVNPEQAEKLLRELVKANAALLPGW